MKFIFLLCICLVTSALCARPSVTYNLCTFDNPSGKPYAELYLSAVGSSVKGVQNTAGKFQGAIQVTLVLKKDNSIVFADKYKLDSPESDKPGDLPDFADMQRIPTGNGTFRLELSVSDVNHPGDQAFMASRDFLVDFPTDRISISDI